MYTYIHTYVYMYLTTINGKAAINLKEKRGVNRRVSTQERAIIL